MYGLKYWLYIDIISCTNSGHVIRFNTHHNTDRYTSNPLKFNNSSWKWSIFNLSLMWFDSAAQHPARGCRVWNITYTMYNILSRMSWLTVSARFQDTMKLDGSLSLVRWHFFFCLPPLIKYVFVLMVKYVFILSFGIFQRFS